MLTMPRAVVVAAFLVATAVIGRELVPRYEVRPLGNVGGFVRVDRWRGDVVFTTPEIRDRRMLDGGTQYASPEASDTFLEALASVRRDAARRRTNMLTTTAGAVFMAGVALVWYRRHRKPAEA